MGTRTLTSPKTKLTLSATAVNTSTTDTSRRSQSTESATHESVLTSGINQGQANRVWVYDGTLSSGASETIDVYDMAGIDIGGGDGNDILGQPMIIEEIVSIMIKNTNSAGSSGILEIEPASSNGFTALGSHTASNGGGLKAQGVLYKEQSHEDGFDVTDGSNHKLKLTANGAAVSFRVFLMGRHDDEESSSSSSSISSSSSSISSSSASSVSSGSSSVSSSSSISSSSASSRSSSSSQSVSMSSASSSSSVSSSSVSSSSVSSSSQPA